MANASIYVAPVGATINGTFDRYRVFNPFRINLSRTIDNPNSFGASTDDQFGFQVAIDNNKVLVGARYADSATGTDIGEAYLCDINTGTLLNTFTNPLQSTDGEFGYAVKLTSDYVVISDIYSNTGAIKAGEVYIFDVNTGNLLQTLSNPTPVGSDFFGSAIDVSGNIIVTAGYAIDSGAGEAYIFDATTGNLTQTLVNPNAYSTAAGDYFGSVGNGISIDGTLVAIGAYKETDAAGNSQSGVVYMFDATTGSLLLTIDNPNVYGTTTNDAFGSSLDLSGNILTVGVGGEDDAGGSTSGVVYVFNATTGALLRTIYNPNSSGTTAGDGFGYSLSLFGDKLIVGAAAEDDAGGLDAGVVYVFDVTTGELLTTIENPSAFGTSAGDNFGRSVAYDGTSVAIGAHLEDDAAGTSSGKVYIYK